MQMDMHFVMVFVFWLVVSQCLSSTWSTSVNSLFSARNVKYGEIGNNKNLMQTIGNGAQMALEHCQEKFKWDRWNCPEQAFSRRTSNQQTKESSFVSSIKAAGIIHQITRNCSQGDLANCGCLKMQSLKYEYFSPKDYSINNPNFTHKAGENLEENVNWTWGGCSDSLEYGELISKLILDDLEKGKDVQGLVARHNNAVGRKVVRSTMRRHCRCHGVSGSCSLQTCWLQVAPFHEIALELRYKYDKALKIDFNQRINSIRDLSSIMEISNTDNLVYLSDSPNYCKVDFQTGWNGTKGRACSRNKGEGVSSSERRSCKQLCRSCGHRVRRERRRVSRQCKCTFIWCCEVQCDTCVNIVDEFFCE